MKGYSIITAPPNEHILNNILSNYVTNSSLSTSLSNYSTTSTLSSTYVTQTSFNNTLNEYVKKRAKTITDINSLRYGGFYDITNNSAMPSLGWYWIIFLPHASNGDNYRYGTYLAGENGSNRLYICNVSDGQVITSSSWSQL